MTNQTHWQDDIALGGDFDGSLSGLCIMSLSRLDAARNGLGPHTGLSRMENPPTGSNIHPGNGHLESANISSTRPVHYGNNSNHDAQSDNSNHFSKRFKLQHSSSDIDQSEDIRSNNQNKIVRQLKNCLNTSSLNALPNNFPNIETNDHNHSEQDDPDANRMTPHSPQGSFNEASIISSSDDSSTSFTIAAQSPSPSQTCSSITTHSRTSSRSHSPSDMSLHSNNNININNNLPTTNTNQNGTKSSKNHSETKNSSTVENQQVSIYSFKDNLLNSATIKESSYATNVMSATGPMHFKNLHPFSLRQFPLSPYQFSNSSFNHDNHDRYLSHDQPLKTPLMSIEQTQDLLAFKLPPHGPEDMDSQRFNKDWLFEDPKSDIDQTKTKISDTAKQREENTTHELNTCNNQENSKRRASGSGSESQKGFSFNYKSNSSIKSGDRIDRPIDLNISYDQQGCCSNEVKNNVFDESMKHFNPDRVQHNSCFDLRSKTNSPSHSNNSGNGGENVANVSHQYHAQESMFGVDPSKQKFHYVLAAPISVATKLTEDTMTYLNQGQAYEIKLENMTDVAEAKKGFMCSIINIGFHERHMQQAENELWQQWSQQHPNEKIFSVDMKLSYNVFGVESDGLNKYEFLWDSSKVAGVFIRINSISTEFTPKKHGGEKGVPFKLSIETFSYNSKTHDSFFISAACCQIKVFKPKGAERKIRSDRDKVSKRHQSEQEKYHRSSDHTTFRECSLTSLHPMADGSLCYYRHSHGHFASKQVVTTASVGATPNVQAHQTMPHHSDEDNDRANNSSQNQASPGDQSTENKRNHLNNDSETSSNGQGSDHQRNFHNHGSRNIPVTSKNQLPDYSTTRNSSHSYTRNNLENSDTHNYNQQQHSNSELNFNHSTELLQLQQPSPFNHMYHNNQVRGVAGLTGLNNSPHFGMAYYGHSLPGSIASHVAPQTSYGMTPNNSLTATVAYPNYANHNFPIPTQQHVLGQKSASSTDRQLINEKQIVSIPTSQATSFKVSTSHNNFQSYLGNQHEQSCAGNPLQDLKDTTSNNGAYQHENYDTHLHHPFHTANSHNQQQILRQRSASTSFATTSGHCTTYTNHGNQQRHSEVYAGNTLSETSMAANHWNHGPTNHSDLASPNSVYTQKSSSNPIAHNHDTQAYVDGHHYESNHDQFGSEHNSPHKIRHHNSDSSSSCYSRVKHNQSMVPCNSQQNQFETNYHHSSHLTINSSCSEVVSWFTANRFAPFAKTFNNFSGSDLLRLSKTELIEICGLIDGIRLYNSMHNQPIKPRRVLYVCHKTREAFHPIYLYDVTLNELLRELSVIFRSHFANIKNEDTHQKIAREKLTLNSSSSTDSRSSMGSLSTETITEEVYFQGDHFLGDSEMQHRGRCQTINSKSSGESNNNLAQTNSIGRLLIDGITSVKIVATEQVVQMLEDESMWTLASMTESSGIIEACISACHSKRKAI